MGKNSVVQCFTDDKSRNLIHGWFLIGYSFNTGLLTISLQWLSKKTVTTILTCINCCVLLQPKHLLVFLFQAYLYLFASIFFRLQFAEIKKNWFNVVSKGIPLGSSVIGPVLTPLETNSPQLFLTLSYMAANAFCEKGMI